MIKLPDFVTGYIECALWSESAHITIADDGAISEAPDDDTSFEAHNFDARDIDADSMSKIREECEQFVSNYAADLAACEQFHKRSEWTYSEQAGHDFWLTRNGHGAGFWDRGYGAAGDRLSEAARLEGTASLYYVPESDLGDRLGLSGSIGYES